MREARSTARKQTFSNPSNRAPPPTTSATTTIPAPSSSTSYPSRTPKGPKSSPLI